VSRLAHVRDVPRAKHVLVALALAAPLAVGTAGALGGCGGGRPADAPRGGAGDEDDLPDPKAPNDLPDDPARPLDDGDRPLVDPAKEITPPAGRAPAAPPSASGSARAPR
jgi:hypothetical protein